MVLFFGPVDSRKYKQDLRQPHPAFSYDGCFGFLAERYICSPLLRRAVRDEITHLAFFPFLLTAFS